jgi:preprotein translocase SecE subunit
MEKIKLLFREYSDELIYNVTWPKMDELLDNTTIVLAISLVLATLISAFDFLSSSVINGIYSLVR